MGPKLRDIKLRCIVVLSECWVMFPRARVYVLQEKFGLGRQNPGVDLYSRKVLIEPSTKLLPEWMRFIHGAYLCTQV